MNIQYTILGTLYHNDGVYDEDGNVVTPPTLIPGYHVNSLETIPGADDYLVTPTIPKVVYAGSDKGVVTYFYVFPDESVFRDFIPETLDEEIIS